MFDSAVTGVEGRNLFIQKMTEATRCTIISLDTCLNGMVSREDLSHSLTVRMK